MKTSTISRLIKQYETAVRTLAKIAGNPDANAKLLRKLSMLNDSEIMMSVALNPKTPSEILEKWLLLYDGLGGTDSEFRIHIVYNPSLRLKALKSIAAKDKSDEVRSAALASLVLRKIKNDHVSGPELMTMNHFIEKSKLLKSRKKAILDVLYNHPKWKSMQRHTITSSKKSIKN